MNKHHGPDLPGMAFEPEDLNGHTIEELSDYLDAGRSPADDSIDQSPGCQIALDALQRLRHLTVELIAADTEAAAEPHEGWVQGILAGIVLDARAGHRIPITTSVPDADLGITEGAVRGLIRAAESAVPGVVVGRCRFDGDITAPGAAIRIRVEASVPYGDPIPELADLLRTEITSRLKTHTTLNVAGIDITVHDIQQISSAIVEDR
ncbi:hypothetical protein ACXR2W_13100 [Leucobacter sp. HY1908]